MIEPGLHGPRQPPTSTKTAMGTFKHVLRISERKSVAVTSFKKWVWIHLRDERKNKSVSFSKDDFVNFWNLWGRFEST